MSDSEATNDDSIASRVKNMARLGEKQREKEAPSSMVIELLDDDSDSIASRVKDMARERKKWWGKKMPSTMVTVSDDDSDITSPPSPNIERVKKAEGGSRRQGFNDRSPTVQCEECRRKGLRCTPRKTFGMETRSCQRCADRKTRCSLYQRLKRKGAKAPVKNKNDNAAEATASDSARDNRSPQGGAATPTSELLQMRATELSELLVPLLTDDTIVEKMIKAHKVQKELNHSLQDIARDCLRHAREMDKCWREQSRRVRDD